MHPSAAIATIENDLRSVVRDNRPGGEEEQWLRKTLGDPVVDDLVKRRAEESSRRKPVRVPESLLTYTHLYELRKCLEAISWSTLADSLGKKAEFDVLLNQVERYRNTVAHSRELLGHEASFLEGIAGIIRTRVTIHRSGMDIDSKHYPLIESVHDSFGNEADDLDPAQAWTSENTNLRLQVGDVVKFSCVGWDAQGRELTWTLEPMFGGSSSTAIGTEVELSWTVVEGDVGARKMIAIRLKSSGKHHRHSGDDQTVMFSYAVEPPSELD